jgi:hypothetical protein
MRAASFLFIPFLVFFIAEHVLEQAGPDFFGLWTAWSIELLPAFV